MHFAHAPLNDGEERLGGINQGFGGKVDILLGGKAKGALIVVGIDAILQVADDDEPSADMAHLEGYLGYTVFHGDAGFNAQAFTLLNGLGHGHVFRGGCLMDRREESGSRFVCHVGGQILISMLTHGTQQSELVMTHLIMAGTRACHGKNGGGINCDTCRDSIQRIMIIQGSCHRASAMSIHDFLDFRMKRIFLILRDFLQALDIVSVGRTCI